MTRRTWTVAAALVLGPPLLLVGLLAASPFGADRTLCYVGDKGTVAMPVEDRPAVQPPRTIAVQRWILLVELSKKEPGTSRLDLLRGQHSLTLVGELVGTGRTIRGGGTCDFDIDGALSCYVDCDGGGLEFSRHMLADAFALRVSSSTKRFRMSFGCGGGGDRVVLRYDPATPAVRLDRASIDACRAISSAWIDERRGGMAI